LRSTGEKIVIIRRHLNHLVSHLAVWTTRNSCSMTGSYWETENARALLKRGVAPSHAGWSSWLGSFVRSNHSCIVGCSAKRSNSILMKSERLMCSRAARNLSVPCGTPGHPAPISS
jgi:hypothetical protein